MTLEDRQDEGAATPERRFHDALADQIVQLAIKENYASGAHLTELGLSEKLRVSRSPIREALKQLADRGIVEARPNRGFFLTDAAASLMASHLAGSRRGAVELPDIILRDYANGDLPDTVAENHLTARYGVAASQLRAALQTLSQFGVVHRSQGKGWHFEPGLTTPEALEQSYRFRILVECGGLLEEGFSLDLRGAKRVRSEHERFLAHLGDGTADGFYAINAGFHLLLAESSGNIFVKRSVEMQNRLRRLHEFASFSSLPFERMQQSCDEHMAILDAVEEGDRDFAAVLMRRHLERAPRVRGVGTSSLG